LFIFIQKDDKIDFSRYRFANKNENHFMLSLEQLTDFLYYIELE